MRIYTSSNLLHLPFGNVNVFNKGTNTECRKGAYTFHYGIVTFYSDSKYTEFSFVYLGRIYSLVLSDLKSTLTDNQLIRKAGKFGCSIVQKLQINTSNIEV